MSSNSIVFGTFAGDPTSRENHGNISGNDLCLGDAGNIILSELD